jgi:hypothetical protein
MSLSASSIALSVGAVAVVLAACTGSADSESAAGTPAAPAPPTPTNTVAPTVTAEELPPAATTTTPTTTTPSTDLANDQILSVVGVVIVVDGNLTGINSFTIRLDDGTDRAFIPEPDALFDTGPFSHIRDHLASGTPIRVDYLAFEDGSNVAIGAGDA